MQILASLFFGQTSDLYKKLIVAEQKVDQLNVDVPMGFDPSLFTVLARVKNGADAPYVRDQILSAVARARASLVSADRLADAKSFDRYSFVRGIDSTERVAAVVSRYAAYRRSSQTVNNYYRTLEALTPANLQSTARKYFDDRGLIVTTLSKEPLPPAIERAPSIASLEAPTASAAGGDARLARTWLGEHRLSSGRLYQRIREERGINYGDYAYIEAFPRGMFQFFPDPNVSRSHQIFEIWIRPVVPVNAHMTLRLAVHELDALVRNGLTNNDFEETRDYLMKNVYVMTARQDQQLGYALDSQWYGIGEFADYMRDRLQKLSVDDVNAAIRAASHGAESFGGDRDKRCRRPEAGARRRRGLVDQLRRREAQGATR
jgi:predicted Zn-dependent peptidase